VGFPIRIISYELSGFKIALPSTSRGLRTKRSRRDEVCSHGSRSDMDIISVMFVISKSLEDVFLSYMNSIIFL
jgi:hypothetical protein